MVIDNHNTRSRDKLHTKSFHQVYSSSSSSSSSEGESETTSKNDVITDRVRHSLLHDILPIVLQPYFHETEGKMKCPPKSSMSSNQNDYKNTNCVTDISVLLGVSGGCDSMALFHILYNLLVLANNNNDDDDDLFHTKSHIHSINSILQWNLIVVHFDHQQRGIESDQDRIMVETQCQQFQIPCYTYYWNSVNDIKYSDDECTNEAGTGNEIIIDADLFQSPKSATLPNRGFSQDLGRKWRRRVMQEVLLKHIQERKQQFCDQGDDTMENLKRKSYIGMIMTAHHKDDSEETILLKLLRGVHLTNIEGLATVRQCSNNSNSNHNTYDMGSNVVLETNTPKTDNDEVPMLYWVRPLLRLRKSDLIQYLQQNNYTWREDGSNQSNKYLRNRIRNELIPLLHSILQKEDSTMNVLERRLDNLQQQAADIRNDLNMRVQSYLSENVHGDVFHLPRSTNKLQPFDLVMKEALYEWTKRRLIGSHQLSYDQMQRVTTQLIQYPQQQIWQLNIGNSYNIVRYGYTLRITCDGANKSTTTLNNGIPNETTRICEIKMNGSPTSNPDFNASDGPHQWIDVQILMDAHEEPYQFIQTTVGIYHQVASGTWNDLNLSNEAGSIVPSLSFTPPWKKSSSNSTVSKSIRMNDFLRGQDIPLDERPNISIILGLTPHPPASQRTPSTNSNHRSGSSNSSAEALSLLSTSTSTKVIAVYVPKKQKWIIDRQFLIPQGNDIIDHDGLGSTTSNLSISVVDPLTTR